MAQCRWNGTVQLILAPFQMGELRKTSQSGGNGAGQLIDRHPPVVKLFPMFQHGWNGTIQLITTQMKVLEQR